MSAENVFNLEMPLEAEERWFLKEWLAHQRRTVAYLESKTGWTHRVASQLVNNRIRWNRDHLFAASRALKIPAHELLMYPDEAMHVRRLRQLVNDEQYLRAVADRRAEYHATLLRIEPGSS